MSQISTNWLSPTQSGTVVSGIVYNALGEPTSDLLGNGIQEGWSWLPMRVSSYSAGSKYNFSNTAGVGPIMEGANDSVNGNWTYTYDNFQRLSGSSCTGSCPGGQSAVGFNYLYDPVGNRWWQKLTAGNGPAPQYSFGSWNHITPSNGVYYDSAGNMTADGLLPVAHTYTYDAENRLIKVDNGTTATYKYDAMGRRVTQATAAGSFEYLMDLQGNPVTKLVAGTSTTSTSEVIVGGRHWGTDVISSSMLFKHADWLGTGRAWTNLSGNVVQNCQSFLFGDQLYCWGSASGTDDNFAGMTYDAEDGMYHATFREVSAVQGRWIQPDPAGLAAVNMSNPQTWNRYAYVGNNPLSFVDPTGLRMDPSCRTGMEVGCGGGGGAGGSGIFVDGVELPNFSSLGEQLVDSGAGAVCPSGGDCVYYNYGLFQQQCCGRETGGWGWVQVDPQAGPGLVLGGGPDSTDENGAAGGSCSQDSGTFGSLGPSSIFGGAHAFAQTNGAGSSKKGKNNCSQPQQPKQPPSQPAVQPPGCAMAGGASRALYGGGVVLAGTGAALGAPVNPVGDFLVLWGTGAGIAGAVFDGYNYFVCGQ